MELMLNKKVKSIILAAGKGTRMKSDISKVLHQIYNKELLGYVIDAVNNTGLADENFVIVVVDKHDVVRTMDRIEFGELIIRNVVERKPAHLYHFLVRALRAPLLVKPNDGSEKLGEHRAHAAGVRHQVDILFCCVFHNKAQGKFYLPTLLLYFFVSEMYFGRHIIRPSRFGSWISR